MVERELDRGHIFSLFKWHKRLQTFVNQIKTKEVSIDVIRLVFSAVVDFHKWGPHLKIILSWKQTLLALKGQRDKKHPFDVDVIHGSPFCVILEHILGEKNTAFLSWWWGANRVIGPEKGGRKRGRKGARMADYIFFDRERQTGTIFLCVSRSPRRD